MTFDCMTTEELRLWQMSGGRSPCRDCPAWFRETERDAGRCHQRSIARLAQMNRYNLVRARAKWDNTVVGVSDSLDSATMRDDAASGAYSTGGRVAVFSPGVRR